jgi:hypothetical protein
MKLTVNELVKMLEETDDVVLHEVADTLVRRSSATAETLGFAISCSLQDMDYEINGV